MSDRTLSNRPIHLQRMNWKKVSQTAKLVSCLHYSRRKGKAFPLWRWNQTQLWELAKCLLLRALSIFQLKVQAQTNHWDILHICSQKHHSHFMNRCAPRKNNSTIWKLQSKNQQYSFDVRLLTTVATRTSKEVQFPHDWSKTSITSRRRSWPACATSEVYPS